MIRPAHDPASYGEFNELREVVADAVDAAARRESGVDPHGLDVTEDDLARFELYRLRLLQRLARSVSGQSHDAVRKATLFGAGSADIANAAEMAGANQARRTWPQIDVLQDARVWLRQHREQIKAATAALVAVADRLGPDVVDPHPGPTARERAAHLAAKVAKSTTVQLRHLVLMDVHAWVRDAQPEQDDAEAHEVLRTLARLADEAQQRTAGPHAGP